MCNDGRKEGDVGLLIQPILCCKTCPFKGTGITVINGETLPAGSFCFNPIFGKTTDVCKIDDDSERPNWCPLPNVVASYETDDTGRPVPGTIRVDRGKIKPFLAPYFESMPKESEGS